VYRNEWMAAETNLPAIYGAIEGFPEPAQGDAVSAAQLTKWMKEMHAKGFSDSAVASVVTAWRNGKLAWGSIWHPEQHGGGLSPQMATAGVPGGAIGAGLLQGSGVWILGAAAIYWFLIRRR
jgi:hypothetical protein